MDIGEIAARAGVGARIARYVLTHDVMPGFRGRGGGAGGRPRSFTAFEGFWVAVAALLYYRGVQRRLVADALGWLADAPWPPPGTDLPPPSPIDRATGPPRTALDALYRSPGPAAVLVGDGTALRVKAGGADTGWRDPRTWARYAPDHAPQVVVRLDLATLRAAFADARD
jgi:hypothetical protein